MGFGAAAAAVGAGTGGELFEYNRKNFLYDRKMRQYSEYQIMDFRIRQAELWREDIRDIVGLTAVKMDTYLTVNAVQLGFCVMAFCEGRLAAGTPWWLIGCHTLALAGAFMYLLMSIWLAMHAAVTSKSYEVRLTTQLVRLPVPSWAQLEGARTYGSAFEKVNAKQMFRVPFVMGPEETAHKAGSRRTSSTAEVPEASAAPASGVSFSEAAAAAQAASQEEEAQTTEPADVWGLEGRGDGIYELNKALQLDPAKLYHLELVRQAMQYWQTYDAFARVSMSLGTNQLVNALAYYVVGYVLISNHAVAAAFFTVVLYSVIAAVMIRLDMTLSVSEYIVAVCLVVIGPCLTALSADQWQRSRHLPVASTFVMVAMPIVYAVQACWLMFMLYVCKVAEHKGGALLPTGFRAVMYVDVFGWIRGRPRRPSPWSGLFQWSPPERHAEEQHARPEPGAGPASQAVQYRGGLATASRLEDLPGGDESDRFMHVKRADFVPTTFVPREKKREETAIPETSINAPHLRPGLLPWRLFCLATVMLITLWWTVGFLVLMASLGYDWIKARPMMHELGPETELVPKEELTQLSVQLAGGKPVTTIWPSDNIHAAGLACGLDPAGDGVGGWFASTTRFGLLVSHSPDVSSPQLRFTSSPVCEDIEGESLQDVALACDEAEVAGGGCRALVLHRQGQRLTSCPVSEKEGAEKEAPSVAPNLLVSAWLGEGDVKADAGQEEIASIALAHQCHGSRTGRCAYVETTGNRIAEVRSRLKDTGSQSANSSWYPTHVLRSEAEVDVTGAAGSAEPRHLPSGGGLTLVSGRYLVMLRPEGTLEALDPEGGTSVGDWRLPEDKSWAAVCAMGSSLYLLSDGPSPQVWRFPVPAALQPQVAVASPQELEGGPNHIIHKSSIRGSKGGAQAQLVAGDGQ